MPRTPLNPALPLVPFATLEAYKRFMWPVRVAKRLVLEPSVSSGDTPTECSFSSSAGTAASTTAVRPGHLNW